MEKRFSSTEMENRLIRFASSIIDVSDALPNSLSAKHLSGQIVRSGTSPALNYGEAQAAESHADFLHKMKVCLKELRETLVNLKIISLRPWLSKDQLAEILKENNELVAIFVASTKTLQQNKRN